MKDLAVIVKPLLEWYEHAARVLPWRNIEPDPYKTLVSEIMLQQTRVETVKPYFNRFMQELPDIRALANAPEEKLLKLWEGLGYYSRVRNLQKTACAVMERFHGELPQDHKQLLSLPGIGDYTAGAIASIAFGQPVPAVDGNVIRVCARLLNDHRAADDPLLKKEIRNALEKIYPPGKCSDFTQSLMELGALICLPGNPRCAECPLLHCCLGYQKNTASILPVKKKKLTKKIEERTLLLFVSPDLCSGLQKRPPKGILAGMWEFPALEKHLTVNELRQYLNDSGIRFSEIKSLGKYKHVFSHLEWHMLGYLIFCTEKNAALTWVDAEGLETSCSLPSAFKKYRKDLQKYLTSGAES